MPTTNLNAVPLHAPHAVPALMARYDRPIGPQPENNPLVVALPAIKSDLDWIRQLTTLPDYDEEQLQDPPYVRAYHVVALKDFFVVGERALKLARQVDLMLRSGYAKRNPLGGEHHRDLQRAYDAAQAAKSGHARKIVYSTTSAIFTSSLIGVSGMGKSTTTEAILGSYPQYLVHKTLGLHQVVWLKVDCPKDGNVKELALNILRAFDAVLGTSHTPRTTKNVTVDDLMARVMQLARAHCLGLLVVDELQNVSVRKSGGREELLNWFQELVNELKLPVFILGTFKAREVWQLDVRHTRRAGVMGGATWRPLARGPEFDLLVEQLWSYQWLREPGELTEEFRAVVYEETQGIVAFIVDMFLVCQLHALGQGKETLTAKMFRDVARKDFEFLQPLLCALRSGQPLRMQKFPDLGSYDVDELIQHRHMLIPQEPVATTPDSPGVSIVGRAAAKIQSALGLSGSEAKALVESVLTADHNSHRQLTQDALAAFFKGQDDGGGDARTA